MNIAKNVKTLCVLSLATLGLHAGASLADFDGHRDGFRGNPYLQGPAPTQFDGAFKQQIAQLDARLDEQLQRILDGMENGRVTMLEAIHLLQEHQAINALERKYLRDGRLGPYELADLDRRMDVASQHIRWEKRDADRAGLKSSYEGRFAGPFAGPFPGPFEGGRR